MLDVGTGTGAVLHALARRPCRPGEAIGLDRSAAMLAHVPPLPDGWVLRQGDLMNLPFPAGHFDLVTAAYVLHLLDGASLRRVVDEIGRVLTPGGRFVSVTPMAPRSCVRRPYELLVAALTRVTGSSLGLNPLDPRPQLQRGGLRVERARYVHHGYPSLCVLARLEGGLNSIP